jgi:4-hydroxyphenylacetate 3-monooxygenase
MSDCKTGAEHIKSLQDGRTVYLDGKLVGDVTEHPAFRNAVHSAAALYDFQAKPENLEFMTFRPNGSNRRVNRAWQMPRSYDEMVARRKAMQAWAAQSCGYFGRSPDHLASSLVGQRMGLDVFHKHSPDRAKALADYFDYASKSDLFLTYVIINPQAQRGKDWGEQDEDLVARIVDEDAGGVTIRGAKMLGTSSIMANEVFVANLQPLKPGEEALAFSCAVPMNAKGLRVLSRKSYEQHAVSLYDNPLSARFDEKDGDVFRRRESAVGAHVRVSRHRHVPGAVSRHAGPRLSELPGADQTFGEDRLPGRDCPRHHRSDRHHQDSFGFRNARHAGG